MSEPHQELGLLSPWMNAAGSLGFSPGPAWSWPEPAGAFLTNPISYRPRSPAEGRALVQYPGGFLLHTGLPNPGFQAVLRQYADRWARSRLPVWVHLFSNTPEELYQMVRTLEETEGVAAIEFGLAPFARPEAAFELIHAAVGELPVIVNFPLTLLNEDWLEKLPAYGIAAVSLGAPRGSLIDPIGRLVSGRLYGPGLLPLVMRTVAIASRAGVPVIGGCGVRTLANGEDLLAAGAAAVQLDSPLWF
jgi:dihydroorotate dehydrogenase (NAD+) catalytic subunit